MDTSEKRLIALGQRVARLQDASIDSEADQLEAQARWEALLERPKPRRHRALAAGALAASLAIVWLGLRPEARLSFTVDEAPGEVGAWLVAAKALPVRFSDGSTLRAESGSQLRILDASSRGAAVVLERGVLEANIVHQKGARWSVQSGPFVIEVTGTRFRAGWEPVQQELSVSLFEGSVVVQGRGGSQRRVVRAGEQFTISAISQRWTRRTKEQNARPPAKAPPAKAPPVRTATKRVLPGRLKSSRPPAFKPPRWRRLLAKKRVSEALIAAKAEGLSEVFGSAQLEELAQLARAARLAGERDVANLANKTLRSRFAGSAQAAQAAFLLGRAAQQANQLRAARRWFGLYLIEAAQGDFRAEAMGRLIEVHAASGDGGAARAAAQRYLQAYPKGPHRAYAEQVLSGTASAP